MSDSKKTTASVKTSTYNYDENGHRINRNKSTDHRHKATVGQRNPNQFRAHLILPLEDVAKARQYCRGREIEATPTKGRVARKQMRKMIVADLIRDFLHNLTKNIEMDEETLAWYNAQYKHVSDIRARQDALIAGGANRIPKDQQLKRGVGSESYKARKAAAKKAEKPEA